MRDDAQRAQDSWNFIGQIANDFIRTLPPSAAEAMTAAINHHFSILNPVLSRALGADVPVPPKAPDEE